MKLVSKLSKASLKLNQQDKSSKDTPLTKIIKPKIRERVKQMTLARKQLQELVDEGANDTTMQDCIKQANIWIDGITHENAPQKGKQGGKLGVKIKQKKDVTSAGKFMKLLKLAAAGKAPRTEKLLRTSDVRWQVGSEYDCDFCEMFIKRNPGQHFARKRLGVRCVCIEKTCCAF